MAKSLSNPADIIRNRAAWISAIASLLIFLLKMAAYRVTGSTAVLSDALESIVNVIASGVALYVVRFAAQPADHEHPYGHGKAEYFSSTFEGGMIFFAAVMIIYESVKALIYREPTQELEMGLLIVGGAAILNLALGLYLQRVGKTHQSDALKASGAHVLSDVVTTAGVMLGLLLVLVTDLQWIDPLVAILVGLQLAYSGYKIMRESIGVLMDEQDEEILQNLTNALEKNRHPGIIDIHHLRTIRSGRFHHIDAHLVVPEYWDVAKVHEFSQDYENSVVKDYDFDGELAFHLDPCKKSYCRVCAVENCPIRQKPFELHRPFTVKSLTDGPRPTNQGTYDIPGSTQTN
ncbi:cation diffusion facilitator family transporter [Bdellovibrio sp. 22V]|uniref:cation diffusion facilitator family transporter n=1 Tax=Bdellovibrio sp. 22V TaxID=3044166 RepID=UPI002543ADEB|nr:cation diffusion facilitator family transporter [Bdellovibrio sp. 22V]WII72208.1 cation diffusion facilitator family transporter [Bdellovibrio sp. 22V]